MWVLGIVVVLVVVAAALAWRWMTGPMYRPGDARASLTAGEPPAVRPDDHQRWRVTQSISLHHFEEGSGRDVLVVHGGPGFPPSRPWRVGPLLADRYRLVYYHQRGCGLSSRPFKSFPGSNTYQNMQTLQRTLGLAAQVADIERIRRILGCDRLVLLGHSFGAMIAGLYAAEFPERVDALIFVAPANLVVMPSKPDLFDLVRERLANALKPEYDAYMREYLDFRGALGRTEEQSSAFYGRFARYYGAAAKLNGLDGSDPSAAGYQPLAVYLSMGKHHDYSAAFRGVKAPVMVVHGASDMQPEKASRDFAALFSQVRFVRIEGATHFPFDEQPGEFARIVADFLR
jgi:proline iminopeptidase